MTSEESIAHQPSRCQDPCRSRNEDPSPFSQPRCQTIQIYHDKATKQYNAFKLYSERKDDFGKDESAKTQTKRLQAQSGFE